MNSFSPAPTALRASTTTTVTPAPTPVGNLGNTPVVQVTTTNSCGDFCAKIGNGISKAWVWTKEKAVMIWQSICAFFSNVYAAARASYAAHPREWKVAAIAIAVTAAVTAVVSYFLCRGSSVQAANNNSNANQTNLEETTTETETETVTKRNQTQPRSNRAHRHEHVDAEQTAESENESEEAAPTLTTHRSRQVRIETQETPKEKLKATARQYAANQTQQHPSSETRRKHSEQ